MVARETCDEGEKTSVGCGDDFGCFSVDFGCSRICVSIDFGLGNDEDLGVELGRGWRGGIVE
jgi:hypothetical protein